MPSKDKIDKVVYSYSNEENHLENENRMLKEVIEGLKSEINKLKQNPLIMCEVREIIKDQALIRVPNGSSFMVKGQTAFPGILLTRGENLHIRVLIHRHAGSSCRKRSETLAAAPR